MSTRTEHDLVGDLQIPDEAYYGVHTLRAQQNFTITGSQISQFPELVSALAAVKQAAALANMELGALDPRRGEAIVLACREIRGGALHDQFVVDPIQGGAGTSTNMNANEVIANRALEILGHSRGDYAMLGPLEHVNRGQSTNDVYPTAVKIALVESVRALVGAAEGLAVAYEAKAAEFHELLKMGRTQLQDAVPMTLGQEFLAFAVLLRADLGRLDAGASELLESNLGGTAIGTGINAHPQYSALACRHLADLTGEAIRPAENLIAATADTGAFVHVSGVLKSFAVKLSKTCNDLRLLSSGPRAGLSEINLPAVQAGSSIMPGKVNPVIPELANQVAYSVIGSDLTVTLAAEAGQLQLNAFEPVIAYSLLRSVRHLRGACDALATRCVAGITANPDRMSALVHQSPSLVTALSPTIGYRESTDIAREALTSGRQVAELVLARGLMTATELGEALAPKNLTGNARQYVQEQHVPEERILSRQSS